MIVVDASVVVVALLDDADDGTRVRNRLRGEALVAPALIDLEVLSALRRAAAVDRISVERASRAVQDLSELAIERAPHDVLIWRCWELRENLTPYDAAYVALAEALDLVLVTGDERISRAPGVTCQIEVLSPN